MSFSQFWISCAFFQRLRHVCLSLFDKICGGHRHGLHSDNLSLWGVLQPSQRFSFLEPTLLERAPVDSTRGSHLAWRASSIKEENIGMDSAAIKDKSIVDIHQRATRDFVFSCFASVV